MKKFKKFIEFNLAVKFKFTNLHTTQHGGKGFTWNRLRNLAQPGGLTSKRVKNLAQPAVTDSVSDSENESLQAVD